MLERLWISADKLIVLLLRRKEALHHEWDFHCIAVIQSKKTCLPYNFQYKPYKAACPDAPTVSLTTCRNCYERFWETVLYIGRIDTDRNNEQSNVVIKFRFSTKIWQTFQRKVSGWPLLFNPCLLISLNKGGFAKTLQNRRAGHGPISCQVKQFFEMFLLLLLLHYDLWFSRKSRNA